nr:transposase [Methylobacterium durans]
MSDPTCLPFAFPSVRGKKLTAAFDGGRLTSDGGVLLLAQAARRLDIADKLAAVIPDRRDPSRVLHPLPEILLARILAIACGYEDRTTSTTCAPTPPSSSPAAACPRAGTT